MQGLLDQIIPAAEFVRSRISVRPTVGMILGTGLGNFADQIEAPAVLPYDEVPGLAKATALGHSGNFVSGQLHGVSVLAMQGRFHLYEGYSASTVTLPVRVMVELGIRCLIVSNAAGGLHPAHRVGDLMVLDDHINLTWRNPLTGWNDESLGPRFPDMSCPYDQTLIDTALGAARQGDFDCHRGVYAAMLGPSYETRAEYRMLRRLGADAVGMSTVPEVIVARHAGIRTLGMSVITNLGRPDSLATTDGHAVEAAAATAEVKMSRVVQAILMQESR